ncbi:uncharacterized protein BCR38DRAFT_341568 [Pseudomassariella vexata]|uniref:F-box domain-containing protein n=1 Tax=Pseudomassariella vexata TaxID=1141098 RepID=A0A1Y2E1N8_9PEZI|nr:uncharacterized protein BCR38DRAFT_341568 [Pseudomassariella vexata]ORY65264.1 hypothetical protein BCR38DRAFT_341568 [Pseudomassariella vexata]
MAATTDTEALSAAGAASAPMKAGNILDLPEEVKKEIVGHCSQCDLICLSIVCKDFHELAAAQLYRNFHIVFPDEDDPSFDSPIDGLAGGLDTFVTSEYNYAKHLRDLSLDTLSSGNKAEMAYKPYLYSVSCGKFMNTLLLLTLRKAKLLDTFRWNIRVELSRPVYKALHDIPTLKHLLVRMQAGPSLYEPPPPLPYYSLPSLFSASQWPDAVPQFPPLQMNFNVPVSTTLPVTMAGLPPPLPGTTITYGPPPILGPPTPIYKPSVKSKSKTPPGSQPPTLGGFKQLESLSILDIDNLDDVDEIKTSVRNSASTLKKLKLSFSDGLATQARRPCVDMDSNESDDDDDDFQIIPMHSYDDGNSPHKAFHAQEERKSQEGFLGRIFEVEPAGPRIQKLASKKKKTKEPTSKTPGREYIDSMQEVSGRLLGSIHGTGDLTQAQQDILDIIVKAAKKYVDAEEKHAPAEPGANSKENIKPGSNSNSGPEQKTMGAAGTSKDGQASSSSGLFDNKTAKSRDDENGAKPEDIDVTAPPDEQLTVEAQEDASFGATTKDDSSPASTSVATPMATDSTEEGTSQAISQAVSMDVYQAPIISLAHEANYVDMFTDDITLKALNDVFNKDMADALNEQLGHKQESLELNMTDVQHELNVLEAEITEGQDDQDTPGTQDSPPLDRLDVKEELQRQISAYARGTRGISLDSLSIHLIPVKASVLGRAIDLRSLRRITLLNVGNQVPIWTLMAKENKVQPLALRKIFTDHVSQPFLHLVSQLECVTDLFMLERNQKHKPESFAPKSKVTLEQIRKYALRKHMATMRRLLLRNEADHSWDVDERTIKLICKRGKVLEELALVMGIRAIHAFLQHISGLIKLRALHIIAFRNEDTCLSVMRETRHFIIDTVSHYPQLQLEWISMGDEDKAERIIRKTDAQKKSKQDKDKGKGKTTANDLDAKPNSINPYPILPVDGLDVAESESEDEDDGLVQPMLKLDLIDNIQFYDVWGVRIFKKEVLSARL